MQSTTIIYSGSDMLVLALLVLWTLPWKAVALWKAARNGSKWWFFFLIIVNTAGILEILYIFIFSKKKSVESPKTE